jgi:hypothetical protein
VRSLQTAQPARGQHWSDLTLELTVALASAGNGELMPPAHQQHEAPGDAVAGRLKA